MPRTIHQLLIVVLSLALFLVFGSLIASPIQETSDESLPSTKLDFTPDVATPPVRLAAGDIAPFAVELTAYDGLDYGLPAEFAQFINVPLVDVAALQRIGLLHALMEQLLDAKEDAGEAVDPRVWTLQEEVGQRWLAGDYPAVGKDLLVIVRLISGDPSAPDTQVARMWRDDSMGPFVDEYRPDDRDILKDRIEQGSDMLKAEYGEEGERLGAVSPLALDLAAQIDADFEAEDYAAAWPRMRQLFTLITGSPTGWEEWERASAAKGETRLAVLGEGDLFLGALAKLTIRHEALLGAPPTGEFGAALESGEAAWKAGDFTSGYAALQQALALAPAPLQDDAAGIHELLFATSLGALMETIKGFGDFEPLFAEYGELYGLTPELEARIPALKAAVWRLHAGHVRASAAELHAVKEFLMEAVGRSA